jgi:hypothetical protein
MQEEQSDNEFFARLEGSELDNRLLDALNSLENGTILKTNKLFLGHESHGPDNVIAGPREWIS